jgi:hypothetical protein
MKLSELVWDQTNRNSENIVSVGEWPGQGASRSNPTPAAAAPFGTERLPAIGLPGNATACAY